MSNYGPPDPDHIPWSNADYHHGTPIPDHFNRHKHPARLDWLGERPNHDDEEATDG